MALIGQVESRSLRGRLFHAAIFAALLLGGATMVYPFLVMVSGSVRSEVDQTESGLVPGYLADRGALYRKFLETKYNQDVEALNRAHRARHFSFRDEPLPEADLQAAADRVRDYFEQARPPAHWQVLGGVQGVRTVPENLRRLRQALRERYGNELGALAKDLGTPVSSWHTLTIAAPDWLSRRYDYAPGPLHEAYDGLRHQRPAAEIQLVDLTGHFLQTMIYPTYGRVSTDAYNADHAVPLESFSDFELPATVPGPDEPTLRRQWIEYVMQELNPAFVMTRGVSQDAYDTFLTQTAGTPTHHALPDGRSWLRGGHRDLYQQFIASLEPEQLQLQGPEYEYHHGRLPDDVAALEAQHVLTHHVSLRTAYLLRNYINVFDELVLQGSVLFNTVWFCVLAIVLSLLVNPMSAYALSRYKLPATYKVLLFLMATMAFPPMVTLIPQFILLRELGLLNTFTALVLPLMVNGYMIFLLKGFFDSLPKELYEAARIDGASELRMFFQISMALSKPILAVLALGTFTSAYMMFLYPLLVAPDQACG